MAPTIFIMTMKLDIYSHPFINISNSQRNMDNANMPGNSMPMIF